ncbi:transcriptional regulator, partial [Salmonella enterica]|nr:transcriptional regulator [Salmonella enterica]EFU6787852.1 transcriptional regulator [Salmonella enterica]
IISNENKSYLPSSLKKEGYKYMALLFALLTMVIMVIYSIR